MIRHAIAVALLNPIIAVDLSIQIAYVVIQLVSSVIMEKRAGIVIIIQVHLLVVAAIMTIIFTMMDNV